jgi:FHA domain/TIR domain
MVVLIIVVVGIILAVALVVAFIFLLWRRRMKSTSAVDNDNSDWPHQPAPPYGGLGTWNQQGATGQTPAEWGQPAQQQSPGNWGAQNQAQSEDPGGAPAAQQSGGWGTADVHNQPAQSADPWSAPAAQPQQPVANSWGNPGISPPEPDPQGTWKEQSVDQAVPPAASPSLPAPALPKGGDFAMIPPLPASGYRVDNGTFFLLENASPRKLAHEYLQFTVFYSRIVPTMTWNTLLVYAHLDEALQIIREDALKFQEEIGSHPSEGNTWTTLPLLRGTSITVVPTCQGVHFNPERSTFTWIEDWHQIKFRFQVDQRLAGTTGSGEITLYAGPLIIGSVKVSMRFLQQELTPHREEKKNLAEASAYLYKRIFTSYSHQDTPVVLACRNVYKALGFESLTDIDMLRSGQRWNTELMKMIDTADLFQLFWSTGAAQSAYVRQEWQYALHRSREEGFIRPVYWEQPLVSPPVELNHLHFAYIDLPRLETPDETPKLPLRERLVGRVRVEQGKELGRIYEIRKDALRIGRSRECDVFLEDVHVSRLHASILTMNNGSLVLRDEGSANGTRLNGQRVNKDQVLPLTDGDRIQIDETVLVFLKGNAS